MKKSLTLLVFVLGLYAITGLFTTAHAQGQERQITFTGFITGGKSNDALPGAYIYIPKAGKGVLSAPNGYFALPVFPGDSVIFSYVGFRTQYHIIPRRL